MFAFLYLYLFKLQNRKYKGFAESENKLCNPQEERDMKGKKAEKRRKMTRT